MILVVVKVSLKTLFAKNETGRLADLNRSIDLLVYVNRRRSLPLYRSAKPATAQPETITSIGMRDWARVGQTL